jgi:Phage tail lysozyme
MKKFIRDFNATVLDAAAVFGNAGHESGGLAKLQEIKPTVKGSRGGYGWFQWTGPRRRAFEAFCKAQGLKPQDDEANYRYLVEELRGAERPALAAMARAKTLYDKVVAFEMAFERAGVKHYPSRMAYAERALKAYRAANSPLPKPDAAIPQKPQPKPDWTDPAGIPDLDKPIGKMTTIWGAAAALVTSMVNTFMSLPAPVRYGLLALGAAGIAWIVRERLRRRAQQRKIEGVA